MASLSVLHQSSFSARARAAAHILLLALPVLLVVWGEAEVDGVFAVGVRMVGLLTLLFVPGYALAWALGRSPLTIRLPPTFAMEWTLIVPMSLAVDALVGTLLVVTPIGLSTYSLWLGLSAINLLAVAAAGVLR